MQFPNEYVQPSTCLITSKTFTELTSYGFNDEVAKRGNPHKWLIDFATRKLTHKSSRSLQAFLDSLDGRYGTFTLPSPLPFLGDTTSFAVSASASAGVNQISVKNLPVSKAGALVAGDFIKFANHDKVYKIVNDAATNASGITTMVFYPRLQANVFANSVISEAVFTLRLTKDTTGLNLTGGTHNIIKISAIEV